MEETIDLKELLGIIWNGKKNIAICVIICILFAGTLSWFVIEEKYESEAIVQVVSGVQDTGIMANYIAAEFTPNIYAQRIQNKSIMEQALLTAGVNTKYDKEDLTVTVNQDSSKNTVELKFLASSPEKAQQQLQIFMDTTKQTMNESVQITLQDLETTYKQKSSTLTKEIESIIEQYNQIVRGNNLPNILILQTVLNSGITLNITEEQTKSLSNVGGNLQNQLLQLQAQIQSKSDEYRRALADYQSIKSSLENFKPDPFVRVITDATLAEEPSTPNKPMNIAIALVLGALIGVGIVFSRYYWKNSGAVK